MSLLVSTGKYTGDGSDPKTISGCGFTPKVVIVFATVSGTANNNAAQLKTADMTTGSSGETSSLGAGGPLTAGLIDSFTSDGFLVRGDKNLTGIDFYWIAFAGTSCVTGSYTGTAIAHSITGIGFKPKWAIIVPSTGGTTVPVHKSTITGDSTDICQRFNANADVTDGIKSLDSDGFTIGLIGAVNTSGRKYYYICMTGDNITSGTYTGNGADNRNFNSITPFNPISVMVKSTTTTQAVWRTKETGDLTNRVTQGNGPIADLIQQYLFHGFQVGATAAANQNTNTLNWIAFGRTGGDGGNF